MEKLQKIVKFSKLKTVIKRGFKISCVLVVLLVGFTVYANLATAKSGEGKIFDDVSEVPAGRVGLVFGCSAKLGNRTNMYFHHRIEAAAHLWNAGKVSGFIVSGDNRREDYNEPEDMKQALIARGVPSDKIVCDFAGLRTFDSVVRAKEVFGLKEVVFVSQRFQNERAQYMADQLDLDAVSYVAKDVTSSGGRNTKRREVLARPKMVLDFYLLGTKPKHLGKKEDVPFL